MAAQHTPGPWSAHCSGLDFWYVNRGEDEFAPALASTWSGSEDQGADARLMAAAPEMKLALVNLLTFFERPDENSVERFERIAAEFYRETGMLAPGKSEPVEFGREGRDEERRERFERWRIDRVEAARAAIAKAVQP